MSSDFPLVPLGNCMLPIERPEVPITGKVYRQIGVRLWGEGAYEREPIDGSQTKYSILSHVDTDDIIVNKIWARNGSVAVVPEYLAGSYGSGEFPTFTPIRKKMNPRWFHWFTKTRDFWKQCDEKSRGTSGKNRIRPEKFLEILIPLPSLEEQHRIVAQIEELATKIEEARGLRREAYATIGALRASAMNALFSSGENMGWPIVTLGEVADIQSGVTLGRMLNGSKITLPYLRVANVQDGYLDLSIMKEVDILVTEFEKWQLKSGDILLTEGGDWDKLGRGAVWRGEIPNCIHQNHIFRVRVNAKDFDPDYLVALISSPYGKSYFRGASKQTTNLATINQKQLKAFRVFKPPLLEQEHIVTYLDVLQSKVNRLKQLQSETTAELDALLPSILDKAFKGEL